MQTRNARRITGIDVARAVALVGMFFSHLTFPDGIAGEVLYGFPSALFAFVAGVSMALMAARGATPAHFIVRGAALIALHPLLALVPTDIYIVLGTLGICMIALAWAPEWDSRWLVALMVPLTILSALQVIPAMYSPPMWAVLMLAGVLFYRHVLGSRRRMVIGAVIGLIAMAGDIAARWYLPLNWFFDAQGHTGGVVDVVGSTLASISITALSCLCARPWQRVVPRMGAMPLTLYCLHVITSPWIGIVPTLLGAALLATLWLQVFPRGPLEEALRRIVATGAREINRTLAKENDYEPQGIARTDARRVDAGRDTTGRGALGDGAGGTRNGEHHLRG